MGTSSAIEPRDLLVALNAATGLARDAVCKLAPQADRWSRLRRKAERREVAAQLGISTAAISVLCGLRRGATAVADEQTRGAREHDARILTRLDPEYPPALLDLDLPPPAIYVRGSLPARSSIAIVGSRKADPYAIDAATLFGRELARSGLAIVSGLARGVDAAAHRAALEPSGGKTVAVQACGIDRVYPGNHHRLAAQIVDAGAVVTEFPLGTPPHSSYFPIRNRLIAALSVGTLVIQAARRSGTLITARLALELGREVFAVPGPLFAERGRGANELIRDGAVVALDPRDVLEALPIGLRDRLVASEETGLPLGPELTGFPTAVLEALATRAAMGPDELATELAAPVDVVLSALLELELAGFVRRYPGPLFHRAGDR